MATVEPGKPRLVVRDDCPGMLEAQRAQVPEHFSQAHEGPHGGIGIGLSVRRQIIGLHGGRIEIERAAGGATRFAVSLPVGTGEQAVPRC